MKRPFPPILLAAIVLALGCTPSLAQLRVDFNLQTGTSPGVISPNLTGFQSYQTRHENSGDFTAVRPYSAFGTTVNLTAGFPDSASATTRQMFDRPDTNDATWKGAWIDLLTDWIGVDTRTSEGGNGAYDGNTGSPTRLLLRLGGLPAGTYTWRSYHHDTQNQNMNFMVQVSTNGGTSFSNIGTFEMSAGTASEDPAQTGGTDPDPRNLPSTVTFPISASGGQDVVVAFVPLSSATDVSQAIFGCNGFELYDPANPPPGPVVTPPPQADGTYSLDFGTVGSPVETGFAAVLGQDSAKVTIHGATFELRPGSQSLMAGYRPAVSGKLISDFVCNPATINSAAIVLRVTGLPAGTYTLESWHYDPTLAGGMIQLEKRPAGTFNSTLLVDQRAFGEEPATASFTTDGSDFEIVAREDSTVGHETRWNGLRIAAGTIVTSHVRPRSPWVFRTLMENRTRMLVAALDPKLWVSFNPGNCCIDRVWAGNMVFQGKVYNDSQLNPWINGTLYHRFPNTIFEATNEPNFPPGWTIDSGTVVDASAGTSFINSSRDKRTGHWFRFGNPATVTSASYDLSHHKETTLFFEEKQNVGTNWNLVAGSGSLRIQVSEDNGSTWTSQDFFSTTPNLANQFNLKQILSRSPNTKIRFIGQNGQYANITLEGEYEGWTAATAGGPVKVDPNWLGYRTLHRDESVTLRYQLRMAGGAGVLVEETPEAIPQASGPPKLERKFAVSGMPVGTTVSLRLGRDAANTTNNIVYTTTESWSNSGAGALRTTGGVTFLDLTADGTATVTAKWTP